MPIYADEVAALAPTVEAGLTVSDGQLRHLAFFEELGQMEESDPKWRTVSAGLVAMRLVDRWITQGGLDPAQDAFAVGAVRREIEAVDRGTPARSILLGLLESVSTQPAQMAAIAPRLLAFARTLEYDARWPLAIDVYKTVIENTHPIKESDSAITAHLRMAASLRTLGDVEGAAAAYDVAGKVAAGVGDMMGVLRARIGDAKIAIMRGNLPGAETILDETIATASARGLHVVEAMALQDRSATAGLRGNYEMSIQLAYRALTTPESNKDRILHDIAVTFLRLGVRSAARDAYLVLAGTAQDQFVQWSSTIALLEIAACDQMSIVFERYHRQLSKIDLPPALQADFEHTSGRGYMVLGRFDESRVWLIRAMETATKHGLHQTTFDVERALQALDEGEAAAERVVYRDPPEGLVQIADAIHEMRTAAGVG